MIEIKDITDTLSVNYLPGEAFLSVSDYDSGIRNLVPHYDSMLGILSGLFPAETSRILELGSGTGELTLRLLDRCPVAEFFCIDHSERMLRLLQKKVTDSGLFHRVHLEKRSMAATGGPGDVTYTEALFDGCASSLAMHHLTHDEKALLLNRLYQLIREGGRVWWADVVEPEDESMKPFYRFAGEQWLSEMNYNPEMFAGKKIVDLYPSMAAQHFPETVSSWQNLFRQAGFQRFDVIWKFFGLAIFGAVK